METKQLEPVKESKRILNKEEIARLLQERKEQALNNAIAYTTEKTAIEQEVWKRRQRFGIAPLPGMHPLQEEKEHDAPVPVSHAKRRTKQSSQNVTPHFQLPNSASDEDLLMWLYLFGYLDIEQFTRLVHRLVKVEKYHITKLREKINERLLEKGLVEVSDKPRKGSLKGRPPIVYSLTNKGKETLGKQKVKVELDSHVMHLNDLLVSALLLPTVEPRIMLEHFEHGYLLKQRPIPIGNNNSVVPDGFVSYSLDEPYGVAGEVAGICFEWDEGSETPAQLRDKFTNWITAANGAYQDRFGINSLTIAFCCEDDRRVTHMLKIAEQVLVQKRSYAELFVFGAFDPSAIHPLQLLTAPLFKQPFDSNNPCSLIETHNQEERIQSVPEVPQPEVYQPYDQGYQGGKPETEYTGIQQTPYAQESQEQQIIQPQKQQGGTPLSPAQPQQPAQPEKYAISPILHLPIKQTIDKNEPAQSAQTSRAQVRPAMVALEERYKEERKKGLISLSISYSEWLNHEVNKILEEEEKKEKNTSS